MRYSGLNLAGALEVLANQCATSGELIGEADCLWGLAGIARKQSRNEEARSLYEQARDRHVRAGGLSGEADCLSGLADTARMQSRNEEARSHYEQARDRHVRARVN